MAIYSYRATTMQGAVVEGSIEAADEKAAVEMLRNTGVIPLKVEAPREGLRQKFFLRYAKGDVLTFTTELTALLGAGLPLDRSLNIISEVSESKEMKGIVQSVLKSIREGSSFSDALQKHPKVFPKLYINMVRAGEAGGVLDVVLEKLNEFLESSKELRDHIISSMIYPAILMFAGGLSVIFMFTFVLPRFSTIFSELGASLPLSTKIILAFSSAARSYWWIIGAAMVAAAILFAQFIRTPEGRLWWDGLKLKMLRDVVVKVETARFCRTLGTLLKSGVPLLQALGNSRDVVGNRVFATALEGISRGAKEGKGLSSPLAAAGVFPRLALSMIRVGEETGQLDTMLLKVASTYEKSLKEAIKRFMGLLEPMIIIIMALIIGFIVVSVFMAIFSILQLPF
ncbi:MAG TPA: type II secretion system F family protein [Dissulfurispiraceae bacterium]|nr:type II secretion system F family protein [Dissulfurispiraceae bacterium]